MAGARCLIGMNRVIARRFLSQPRMKVIEAGEAVFWNGKPHTHGEGAFITFEAGSDRSDTCPEYAAIFPKSTAALLR